MLSDASPVRVSCIVPAFNEEARIAAVLRAIVGHPLIAEVIVVDDGSTDHTAQVVEAIEGVRLVRCGQNVGKSIALCEGIDIATGQVLLFVDADLSGLAPAHITSLLEPVLVNRADISFSLRANTPGFRRLIGLDYITGERVVPAALLRGKLNGIRGLPRFGFEVFLNEMIVECHCRIAVIGWPGVESPRKSEKQGLLRGLVADALMVADICKTVSPLRLARQILALLRLRVELIPLRSRRPWPRKAHQSREGFHRS